MQIFNFQFSILVRKFFFVPREQHGFGLVEIIIITAVVTTTLAAFAQASLLSVHLLHREKESLEATLLAQEALEAVRAARDESWTANIAPLTNGTVYYPVIENGKWKLSTTPPALLAGQYTRYVIFGSVSRNSSDQISPSGTLDTGTRKVTARVLWGSVGAEQSDAVYEGGTTDGNLASFPSANAGDGDPAQSFTTLAITPFTVSGIELFLKRVAATNPSDIYLEIRSGSTLGPVVATSGTIDPDTISSAGLTWTRFTFPSAPVLAPATQYFLRLRSVPDSTVAFSGSQSMIHWGYRQTGPSPYAGGDAWRYVGRLSNPSDQGQILTQYDFSFRVLALTQQQEQREVVAYITNLQEQLGGQTESKVVFYESGALDANLAGFPSPNTGTGDPAQMVTSPAAAIEVTRVDLYLRRAAPAPSDVFVELRTGPTGAALGISQVINGSSISSTTPAWVEFRFATPVPLAASTAYAIRLRSIPSSTDAASGSAGAIHWIHGSGGGSGPYSGGDAYRYVGRLSNPLDTGEALSSYDYNFRLYDLQ